MIVIKDLNDGDCKLLEDIKKADDYILRERIKYLIILSDLRKKNKQEDRNEES